MNHGHAMNGYRADVASMNSNSFNDFLSQDVNPTLLTDNSELSQVAMPNHNQQNQWQELAMQMNMQQTHTSPPNQVPQRPQSLPSNMPPLQQMPFNPTTWPNPTQLPLQQQFTNGFNPLAFNMPLFSQQIMQEALSMSSPVEPADEPTLLNKLLNSARKKESYKDALNSLHGKNGHSATLWKDYYLDNKDRLDAWIILCLQKEQQNSATALRSASSDADRGKSASLPTLKKPKSSYLKREPSSPVPHATSSRLSHVGRPPKKAKTSTPPQVIETSQQGGRRSTINSLTAPSPVFDHRLPPPNAEVKIPDPPSRSPSPPTNLVPHHTKGYKYTPEDRDFFIKFIGWRLKHDPKLTRLELCNLLAEKAAHHTAQSWTSYWSNNHDVPDKILAAARGEGSSYDSTAYEEDSQVAVRKRPTYKDPSTTEESDDDSELDDDSSSDNDGEPVRRYSESQMAQKGTPFNDADQYIVSKYISNFHNWENASTKDRWDPFVAKYSQRSAKAWAEYYRRNEHVLRKLVKKIMSEATGIDAQVARPSRALMKRKIHANSDDEQRSKRGKV